MINTITEVSRCLLCLDAPCTEACPKSLDPVRGIRALLFEDDNAAPSILGKRCVGCHLCMLICPVGAIYSGARIPKLI